MTNLERHPEVAKELATHKHLNLLNDLSPEDFDKFVEECDTEVKELMANLVAHDIEMGYYKQ